MKANQKSGCFQAVPVRYRYRYGKERSSFLQIDLIRIRIHNRALEDKSFKK
jgi:hypothetical protein